VAHRISQPLAAIVGYARGCQLRLRNETLGPEDLDRALEDIAQEALRAGALLRTLRETMTEQTK
jgi:signal transduction histidine kinase